MPDSDNVKQARRIYKDLESQAEDSSRRLGDPFNPSNPPTKVDEAARSNATMLQEKLKEKYPFDNIDNDKLVEPANPSYYGR